MCHDRQEVPVSRRQTDGCKTELAITKDTVEICMSSIESGVRFPRGYYRFCAGKLYIAERIQAERGSCNGFAQEDVWQKD